MKMMNTIKRSSALLLILALLFLPLTPIRVKAAVGVDTAKECSLTFEEGQMDAEYAELKSIPVAIRLYQVATMTQSGAYTLLPGYETLELPAAGAAQGTAEVWQKQAEAAVSLVREHGYTQQAEVTLHDPNLPQAKIEGLAVGMYLVMAQTVQSPEYEYAFTPYLISLPNNYYESTGDDAWVYDVTTELKPDRVVRYGDLEIVKKLTSYSATFQGAFFVFEVEGEKDGKKVYSDVVSLNFEKPGEKKALVEHLPAGTQVTVTEVYAGASYQPVSAKVQKAVIAAEGTDQNPVRVAFENEYDHHPNGGSGIVNHFKYNNGAWDVEQQADNGAAPSFMSRAGTQRVQMRGSEEVSGHQLEVNPDGELQTKGAESPEVNAAPPQEAQPEAVTVADNAPQEAQPQVPAEAPAEQPMDQQKVDDEKVPLADLVSQFFEDGNATALPAVAAGVAAVVMGATFVGVMVKKTAGMKSKSKSSLRREKE